MNKACFCGSKILFNDCCEPIIEQQKNAQSAEQLMRSRFSAFCTQHATWLIASADKTTRPQNIQFEDDLKWIDLTILSTKAIDDEHHTVEFEARYFKAGKVNAIHENSRFNKREEQWFYVDGDYLKTTFKAYKLGRNDSCVCGSGHKFKNCCEGTLS